MCGSPMLSLSYVVSLHLKPPLFFLFALINTLEPHPQTEGLESGCPGNNVSSAKLMVLVITNTAG